MKNTQRLWCRVHVIPFILAYHIIQAKCDVIKVCFILIFFSCTDLWMCSLRGFTDVIHLCGRSKKCKNRSSIIINCTLPPCKIFALFLVEALIAASFKRTNKVFMVSLPQYTVSWFMAWDFGIVGFMSGLLIATPSCWELIFLILKPKAYAALKCFIKRIPTVLAFSYLFNTDRIWPPAMLGLGISPRISSYFVNEMNKIRQSLYMCP